MFSSADQLKQKTPAIGLGREEYIRLLVEEYYETTDIEAKEQVTANLANFAYDPINYEFLKRAHAFALFLELIDNTNPVLVQHGITGLCNFCFDPDIKIQLSCPERLELIIRLLNTNEDDNIKCNCITTLIFLLTPETRSILAVHHLKDTLRQYTGSSDDRLKNLAIILLEHLEKL